jgi:hypothetical protein
VARYFFDTHDDDKIIEDDIGTECGDLDAVKAIAALSLAELARDVLPSSIKRHLAVKVHDGPNPVLESHLIFEAIILKPKPLTA